MAGLAPGSAAGASDGWMQPAKLALAAKAADRESRARREGTDGGAPPVLNEDQPWSRVVSVALVRPGGAGSSRALGRFCI
jgi:hypothetical protein